MATGRSAAKAVRVVDDEDEEGEVDIAQSSLLPTPVNPDEQRRELSIRVISIDFTKSTFNKESGTKIFAITARKYLWCIPSSGKRHYTIKNPTWDGEALRVMRYDPHTHTHIDLVFQCPLSITPQIDALYNMDAVDPE